MYLLHMLTTVLGGLAELLSSLVYLTPEMGTFLCFLVLLRPIHFVGSWRALEIMFSKCLVLGIIILATVWSGLYGLFPKICFTLQS